jgi:pimeloyl-ACP methyl ester carboxylesterase
VKRRDFTAALVSIAIFPQIASSQSANKPRLVNHPLNGLTAACAFLAALVVSICCAGQPTSAQGKDPLAACQALAKAQIPAAKLALPTGGAVVSAATLVKAADAGNSNGEYCKVTGSINPVDPKAPDIKFQVNLPTNWNGKALHHGGGGYNGVMPQTLGVEKFGDPRKPTPLANGFISFASDSGHQAADTNDASFAMNDEALNNFGALHIKKTRDVAAALAELRYGTPIKRMYFIGGSTGGREALTAAMRWPEAYDGVVAYYPTANFMGLRLWGAALASAVYPNESAGWIPPALVNKIAADALEACDTLDGAKDGIVSNMAACRVKSQALLASLTCKGGETGDPANCLTPAQLKTIAVYHEGYTIPYAFANGITRYEGYNSLEGITMQLGSEARFIDPPPTGPNAHHVNRADQFLKFFVTRDPKFSVLSLDIQKPGPWQQRIIELSNAIDASNPDFSAFKAKGGKLILVQGLDDASVSPYANARLYQSIEGKMGKAATEEFSRFYTIPGLAHGAGKFLIGWAALATIDAWADQGTPPPALTAIDTNKATFGRSRPMCVYPGWPKYKGAGSLDSAESYACATE